MMIFEENNFKSQINCFEHDLTTPDERWLNLEIIEDKDSRERSMSVHYI